MANVTFDQPEPRLGGKIRMLPWIFILMVLALGLIGGGALYSAANGSFLPWAKPHLIRFGMSVVIMLVFALVDIRVWFRLAYPTYAVMLALLAGVEVAGKVGAFGAQRWINLGFVQIQPSELMKIALVMALAAWFHKATWERMGNPLFLIPPAIAVLIPVGLILKEPNLGTAVITGLVGASVFLAAGVRWWKILLVTIPVPFAMRVVYSHLHDYQRARIDTFLNPESDPLGAGYNIIQSKIALGSGGMWGKGYLQGTQAHLNFLPEKQTDFIFTMFAEEFGFVGCLALLALLALIVFGAMAIALRCRHQFGRLVALGIATNFFMYIFVNVAMVTGAIPVGGVPLPLVSYGGSAMLTVMFGFGLLMSVWVHRDVEFKDGRED
jgi:rod shape determining protein RodA